MLSNSIPSKCAGRRAEDSSPSLLSHKRWEAQLSLTFIPDRSQEKSSAHNSSKRAQEFMSDGSVCVQKAWRGVSTMKICDV